MPWTSSPSELLATTATCWGSPRANRGFTLRARFVASLGSLTSPPGSTRGRPQFRQNRSSSSCWRPQWRQSGAPSADVEIDLPNAAVADLERPHDGVLGLRQGADEVERVGPGLGEVDVGLGGEGLGLRVGVVDP